MAEQGAAPAPQTKQNRVLIWVVPIYLIATLIFRVFVPAHEYPMRTEQVLQIAFDLAAFAGLIALRAQIQKPVFWLAAVAGVCLFLIRLTSDASWWTGHLIYYLPPR